MEQLTLDSWCGKMYAEPCQATGEKILEKSSKRASAYRNRRPPLCLCLKKDGREQGSYMINWEDGALHGEYMTHSFGESPSVAVESHLSQILEGSPHRKYYLSGKACQGILRRAERRGKPLPEALKAALEKQGEA